MARRYDDGVVQVCTLTNSAPAGAMPVYTLTPAMPAQYFAETQIGMRRQYLAKGVDEQIDLLIQIWAEERRPRIGQVAVITGWKYQEEESGDQYRIDNVQMVQEEGLDVFLLTLRRLEDNYDFIS